jgi:hypothetical protein
MQRMWSSPYKSIQVDNLLKETAEIESGMAEKPGKQTAKTWFGLEK